MAFSPGKHFRLGNVRLVSSSFSTMPRIESEHIGDDDEIQTRRWNEAEIREGEFPDGTRKAGLFVTVNLGIRRLRPHAPEGSVEAAPDVTLYCVEASFRADFEVVEASYGDEDLDRFSDANACHIVWPFWREHVFRTLRDAALPMVDVPLLAPLVDASTK